MDQRPNVLLYLITSNHRIHKFNNRVGLVTFPITNTEQISVRNIERCNCIKQGNLDFSVVFKMKRNPTFPLEIAEWLGKCPSDEM